MTKTIIMLTIIYTSVQDSLLITILLLLESDCDFLKNAWHMAQQITSTFLTYRYDLHETPQNTNSNRSWREKVIQVRNSESITLLFVTLHLVKPVTHVRHKS